MITREHFQKAKAAVLRHYGEAMGENDRGFVDRVYGANPQDYLDRLQAIGFDNKGVVLDAGCGFGQWSLCLADLGNEVLAADSSPLRAGCTQLALEALALSGNTFPCEITSLSIGDASCDAIFCYGALFCTAWKTTLKEFARVLRKGGTLYFSANDIGYIVNMWMNSPNKREDFDPRAAAAQTFVNTISYEREGTWPSSGQILIAPKDVQSTLSGLGFTHTRMAPEGTLNEKPESVTPKPFFQAEYNGLPGCYEVLTNKS